MAGLLDKLNAHVEDDMLFASGVPGQAATIDEVSVERLPFTSEPTVENSGTALHAKLKFGIPEGVPGYAEINDTKGEGDTAYVWSADKSYKEISDINNLLYDETNCVTKFVQGRRVNIFTIASNTKSCVSDLIYAYPGDLMTVSGIASGHKISIQGRDKNNTSIKDGSWLTTDSTFTIIKEGYYYGYEVLANGNDISAETCTTTITLIDKASRLANLEKETSDISNLLYSGINYTDHFTQGYRQNIFNIVSSTTTCVSDLIYARVDDQMIVSNIANGHKISIQGRAQDGSVIKDGAWLTSDNIYTITAEGWYYGSEVLVSSGNISPETCTTTIALVDKSSRLANFDTAIIQRDNIVEDEDMFIYRLPGTYFISAAIASTLSNYPSTDGGRLMVISGKNNNIGRMALLLFSAHKIYFTLTNSNGDFDPWEIISNNMMVVKNIKLPIHSIPSELRRWGPGLPNLYHSRASTKRYYVKNAKKLTISWTPKENDSLHLITYDSQGNNIGYVYFYNTNPAIFNFVPDTNIESVAFDIYNTDEENPTLPNEDITVTVLGINELKEIKNPSFGSNVENTRWYRFGYYVGDYLNEDDEYVPICTTGMVMFPPNYSANGAPSPVIIFLHGSSYYLAPNGTQASNCETFYEFLSDCGYAIIDCYGWTDRYLDQSGLSSNWPIPTSQKAYEKLLSLMLDSFNFDRNNVFALAKSLGGRMGLWMANTQKINAISFLNPALACNFGYSNSKYREAMIEDMQLQGVVNAELGWTTEEECLTDFLANWRNWNGAKRRAFYLANESQIIGTDPEFINLLGETSAEKLECSALGIQSTKEYSKINFPPMKIWYSMDDVNISVANCHDLVRWVRNGGGKAEEHILPDNTGGHGSTDVGPNALQQENVTTPLGYSYESVPLAYYEVWKFFEQYRKY